LTILSVPPALWRTFRFTSPASRSSALRFEVDPVEDSLLLLEDGETTLPLSPSPMDELVGREVVRAAVGAVAAPAPDDGSLVSEAEQADTPTRATTPATTGSSNLIDPDRRRRWVLRRCPTSCLLDRRPCGQEGTRSGESSVQPAAEQAVRDLSNRSGVIGRSGRYSPVPKSGSVVCVTGVPVMWQ
jgi:hypothetical protein